MGGIKNVVSDFKITSFDSLPYYDDPTLTFEDSILAGCSLDLDFDGLKQFCVSGGFKNLVLFQNLLRLNYIGKYGNSDPHL